MVHAPRSFILAVVAAVAITGAGGGSALARSPTASPAQTPSPAQAPSPATPTSTGAVRLMIVGDVMLARRVSQLIRDRPWRPFRDVVDTFAEADLVLANLESVISDRGRKWPNKNFNFRAPVAGADVLAEAGVDVVSVANNHAMDYSWPALRQEIRLLRDRGIGITGGGRDATAARAPYVVTSNGLTVAFLSYLDDVWDPGTWRPVEWRATSTSPGLALARRHAITRDVAAAKGIADVVVVMFHAGKEFRPTPTARQRVLATTAIDAGAALVVGAHPHVLQGYTRTDTTLIAYSLGNFLFDGFLGAANDSAILDVTLTADGVASVDWIPMVVERALPRPATPEEAARIMARIVPID